MQIQLHACIDTTRMYNIHCMNTWLRYTITLAASKSWPPWFGSAFKMQDIQYGNTARYTIWQYMARYSEIWQDMAMQYGKATALISRMEASHEITKLTDRALAVLEPRSHIWLRILLQNCTFFSLTNNQFYFSRILPWTIKWQKYSMWSTWSCWWWRSQI